MDFQYSIDGYINFILYYIYNINIYILYIYTSIQIVQNIYLLNSYVTTIRAMTMYLYTKRLKCITSSYNRFDKVIFCDLHAKLYVIVEINNRLNNR